MTNDRKGMIAFWYKFKDLIIRLANAPRTKILPKTMVRQSQEYKEATQAQVLAAEEMLGASTVKEEAKPEVLANNEAGPGYSRKKADSHYNSSNDQAA